MKTCPICRTQFPHGACPACASQVSDDNAPTETATTMPTRSSHWQWWPDHPAKRVMVVITALWPIVMLVFFSIGYLSAMNDGVAIGPDQDDRFLYDRAYSLSELRMRAIPLGIVSAFSTWILYFIAIAVCFVFTFAIEQKSSDGVSVMAKRDTSS